MTQSNQKKTSLFKQRMANKNKQIVNGFPEVIKIDTKEQIIQQKNTSTYRPILEQLKQNKTLSQEQFREINKQNHEYLSKLSEKEIHEYQKLISQSFSQRFLQKLRQNENMKTIQQNNNQQNQQIFYNADPSFEKNFNFPILSVIDEQLQRLQINIKTKQLTYESEKEELVQLKKIESMIDTQNNQSLITAYKILIQILIAINNLKFQRDLTIIKNQYFHKRILLDLIGTRFIKRIFRQYRGNKFLMCKIESMQLLLKFIQVGGILREDQIVFIITQSKKLQILDQQIKKCVPILIEKYYLNADIMNLINHQEKQSMNKEQQDQEKIFGNETERKLYLNDLNIISQKILLQESYFRKRQKTFLTESQKIIQFYQDLASIQTKLSETSKIDNFQILFKIVEIIKLRLKIQEEDQLRKFLMKLGDSIKDYVLKTYEDELKNFKNIIFSYKILYVIKNILKLEYVKLIQNLNKEDQNKKRKIETFLIILNVKLYLDQEWDIYEIEIIQQAMRYINQWICEKQIFSYQLIFFKLIKMFKHQKQSYHKLDQKLLDLTLLNLTKQINSNLIRNMLKNSKVKELMNFYIFNSFGNIAFTKVMLYLGSNIFEEQNQSLIITEGFQRYPFIFYQACKTQLYGQKNMYKYELRSQQNKNELQLVYKILKSGEVNKQNFMFEMVRQL